MFQVFKLEESFWIDRKLHRKPFIERLKAVFLLLLWRPVQLVTLATQGHPKQNLQEMTVSSVYR